METFQAWFEANTAFGVGFFIVLAVLIVVLSELKDYRKKYKADGGIVWEKQKADSSMASEIRPSALIVQKDGKRHRLLVSDKEFDSYNVGDVYQVKRKHMRK